MARVFKADPQIRSGAIHDVSQTCNTERERPGEIIDETGVDIMFEEYLVGESQSNGHIKRARKTVQGVIRTMRGAFGHQNYVQSKWLIRGITPWQVKHAAHTISRYHIGSDGNTPHFRVRGWGLDKEVSDFGERILYLVPDTHHKQLHGQGK